MKKIILITIFLIVALQVKAQNVDALLQGTGTTDTTTVALVDTLARVYTDSSNSLQSEMYGLFEKWYRMTIAADDTLLISTDISFPSNKTFKLQPSESWTTERWNIFKFPNVYIKSGYVMPVVYRFSLEGD